MSRGGRGGGRGGNRGRGNPVVVYRTVAPPAPPPAAERNGHGPDAAPPGGMVDLDAKPRDHTPVGRVELFRLDGVVYTIPDRTRANIGLKYLWLEKEQGTGPAEQWLLEELVGEDGYRALMEYDHLETEDMERIMTIAQRVVLGSLEREEGKGPEPGRG